MFILERMATYMNAVSPNCDGKVNVACVGLLSSILG